MNEGREDIEEKATTGAENTAAATAVGAATEHAADGSATRAASASDAVASASGSTAACVYLVGAGPGDPGLLTLRAQELLQKADLVVYDYLASDAVMRHARPEADRIFVGKKGFSAHVTQDQINRCLVDEAKARPGQVIVRLKGGDPFVFGRGGEEALALVDEGIPFEVVPGVTAGVAACAYAGIPVTQRGLASSVTLITGHETPDKPASAIDWPHLAQGTDTLCFYMGIRDLPHIVERLVANGRPATTPVALVRWGTTSRQQTLTGTLADIVDACEKAHFQAPAIIVVGQVVDLREKLSWFERKPLFGRTVAVTRSREQASVLSERLRSDGAEVVEFPTIAIHPRPLDDAARAAIDTLASGAVDWTVFTSANGVACFFDLLSACGKDARAFAGAKVCAIGPATRDACAAHGIVPDAMPARFVAEDVVRTLLDEGVGQGSRVLIPRAAQAREVLPDALRQAGAQVEVLPVYDTVVPDEPEQTARMLERLRAHEVDAITFTSSSTAKNFAARIDAACEPGERQALLEGVTCASIGPVTSKTMRSCDIPVMVEAQRYTIPALADALTAALAEPAG
jgi:uroporphyrinogen III methyltransferase/synthase